MKKQIELPPFESEEEEHEFWANINLADYYTAKDAQRVSFPNLKPTSRPISIRLPEYLLDAIKEKANHMGIPYQSLIKATLVREFVMDS